MKYPLAALLGRARATFIGECETRLAAAGYGDLAISHGTNILRHLREGESMRVADLVRASGVTKQAISQQLAYLEAHGYVVVDLDERDRRGKTVRPTAQGVASNRTIRGIFGEVHRDWRARYGDERMQNLFDTLTDITGLEAAD
ncbi:MAG: helix-turn-helix domain-containing protein [Microbacterium sp.]